MRNLSKWMLGLALPTAIVAGAATVEKNGAKLSTYKLPSTGWLNCLSDNGDWATWSGPSGDESGADITVMDIRKGELVKLPVVLNSSMEGSVGVPNDITDDGKIIVGTLNNQPGYYDLDAQTWIPLDLPRGLSKMQGFCENVTPDGKVITAMLHQNWNIFTGVYWVWDDAKETYVFCNGSKTLPNLPTRKDVYEAGLMLPGDWLEYEDAGDTDGNTRFMQISADGKYIIGAIDHNRSWGNGVFIYTPEDDKWEWITDEYNGKKYIARSAQMSNDGNYLLCFTHGFDSDDDPEDSNSGHSFLINRKTGEVTHPKILGEVSAIDNAGNLYYSVGATVSNPVSSFCVEHNGTLVDLHMILSQVYDIDFGTFTGFSATGFSSGISNDGLVLGMNAYPRDAAYSLIVPKSLIESAGDVNVLANYQFGPAYGTKLAKFNTFVLSLSNQASVSETIKAQVTDEEGKVLAESTEVTALNASNSQFSIAFPEQIFEPGKKYTVTVPEGMFYVPGSKSKNPEVKAMYEGRENVPVYSTNVEFIEGQSYREINISNPIVLTFNTPLSRVNGIYPELYIKGNETPVTTLDCAVNGENLSIYSPIDYKPKQDTEYIVRIPAGQLTDIAGFCPNDEIEFSILGLYVSAPADPTIRFEDNFNNPNASLNNWMQYEGDHNAPSDAVKGFGFDKDNTPWNFSIKDSEDSDDYCAASHSSYTPAGKSDDWMVTSQIVVDHKDIYLSFKTQGYRSAKFDKLKVIVWPCEETYGSVNKEIIDRMREEGDVIFDDRVFPGKSEQSLAGDWQEKEFSLADYEGKKVYIAFVNENNNQSMVFVDDVLVKYTGSYIIGSTTDNVVVAKDEVKVSATLTNQSPNPVKSIKASYNNPLTGSTDSFEKEINLAQGETFNFTFDKPMKLESGVENTYTMTFDVDGDKQEIAYTIKNLKYDFKKKVLVEEITGTWCGNCPQGTLAFDYLGERYPGQIIPVAVHNNDPYAYPAYEEFLKLEGYPSGKVNRGSKILAPMYNGKFYTAERDQTWFDQVSKELETPAEGRLVIKSADWCRENKKFEVEFEVEFAVDKKNMNYRVFTVVLEDGLKAAQHNYFYQQNDPIYGEWGFNGALGQEYALTELGHVARGIAGNSFDGQTNLIPRDMAVDEVLKKCIAFDRPTLASADPEMNNNVSIACVIIDALTGAAITGDIIHTVGVKDVSGADEISADLVEAEILLTVVDGRILANGSEQGVEIYTLAGNRVANESLKGFYIVKATDGNGNSKVAKLMVR